MLNISDVQMLTGTQRNIATASNTQAQKWHIIAYNHIDGCSCRCWHRSR